MLRTSTTNFLLRNHSKEVYSTAKSFDHFGRYMLEFTIYFYRGTAQLNLPSLVMVVRAINLCSRSDESKLILNREDMIQYVDSQIESKLLSAQKLYGTLDRFSHRLVFKRRHLRKRLEIDVLKPHDGLLVCFTNHFCSEKEVQSSREETRFISRTTHESELVGNFAWKHGNHYCTISVQRHTVQRMFSLNVRSSKTFKVGSFRMSYFDVADIVGFNMIQLLGMKFEYVQYISWWYKPTTYAEFLERLRTLNSAELQSPEFRDKIKYISLEKLDTAVAHERFVLIYVWERLVHTQTQL